MPAKTPKSEIVMNVFILRLAVFISSEEHHMKSTGNHNGIWGVIETTPLDVPSCEPFSLVSEVMIRIRAG